METVNQPTNRDDLAKLCSSKAESFGDDMEMQRAKNRILALASFLKDGTAPVEVEICSFFEEHDTLIGLDVTFLRNPIRERIKNFSDDQLETIAKATFTLAWGNVKVVNDTRKNATFSNVQLLRDAMFELQDRGIHVELGFDKIKEQ